MGRNLFLSEARVVANMASAEFGEVQLPRYWIVDERHPQHESICGQFNRDFNLIFDKRNWQALNVGGRATPVLPNTLGAEVFLTVENDSLLPLELDFIGGGAFPLPYFYQYVESIESSLDVLLQGSSSAESYDLVRVDQCGYSRVFVIEGDICFLLIPDGNEPIAKGVRKSLLRSEDSEIDCYGDGPRITCIDGWMRTKVYESNYKLFATSE